MMFTANLQKLATAFKQHDFDVRVVGGAVRDSLLGQTPKDVDLCTNATPEEMIEIVEAMGFAYVPTGIQHGTITIFVDGEEFEVTTLRIDTETDGRHAEVEFTRSFELDAARRDLTINAMSMDMDGNVFDYFNGREDLEAGRIRFVGNADERVKEDYLRILRFFRFMARFGNIESCMEETNIITSKENLEGLKTVSVERYWLEMQKLVIYPYANDVMDSMYYTGVLKALGLGKRQFSVATTTPVGGLSSMVDETTVDQFLETWKLSVEEQKHLRYLVMNRGKKYVDWQRDLTEGARREWVTDLFTGDDNPDAYARRFALEWEVPVFPVKGQDLLDAGMKPGVEVGLALKVLRNRWVYSGFEYTKSELLEFFEKTGCT